jgi:hypothetical protein
MPVRVEIPIRIRVDPLALLERQDDLEDALAAAVGRALMNSRDVVLAQRGGYVGIRVHPPEFCWYGDGGRMVSGATKARLEKRIATILTQTTESAGIFDFSRAIEGIEAILPNQIEESLVIERFDTLQEKYELASYQDGGKVQIRIAPGHKKDFFKILRTQALGDDLEQRSQAIKLLVKILDKEESREILREIVEDHQIGHLGIRINTLNELEQVAGNRDVVWDLILLGVGHENDSIAEGKFIDWLEKQNGRATIAFLEKRLTDRDLNQRFRAARVVLYLLDPQNVTETPMNREGLLRLQEMANRQGLMTSGVLGLAFFFQLFTSQTATLADFTDELVIVVQRGPINDPNRESDLDSLQKFQAILRSRDAKDPIFGSLPILLSNPDFKQLLDSPGFFDFVAAMWRDRNTQGSELFITELTALLDELTERLSQAIQAGIRIPKQIEALHQTIKDIRQFLGYPAVESDEVQALFKIRHDYIRVLTSVLVDKEFATSIREIDLAYTSFSDTVAQVKWQRIRTLFGVIVTALTKANDIQPTAGIVQDDLFFKMREALRRTKENLAKEFYPQVGMIIQGTTRVRGAQGLAHAVKIETEMNLFRFDTAMFSIYALALRIHNDLVNPKQEIGSDSFRKEQEKILENIRKEIAGYYQNQNFKEFSTRAEQLRDRVLKVLEKIEEQARLDVAIHLLITAVATLLSFGAALVVRVALLGEFLAGVQTAESIGTIAFLAEAGVFTAAQLGGEKLAGRRVTLGSAVETLASNVVFFGAFRALGRLTEPLARGRTLIAFIGPHLINVSAMTAVSGLLTYAQTGHLPQNIGLFLFQSIGSYVIVAGINGAANRIAKPFIESRIEAHIQAGQQILELGRAISADNAEVLAVAERIQTGIQTGGVDKQDLEALRQRLLIRNNRQREQLSLLRRLKLISEEELNACEEYLSSHDQHLNSLDIDKVASVLSRVWALPSPSDVTGLVRLGTTDVYRYDPSNPSSDLVTILTSYREQGHSLQRYPGGVVRVLNPSGQTVFVLEPGPSVRALLPLPDVKPTALSDIAKGSETLTHKGLKILQGQNEVPLEMQLNGVVQKAGTEVAQKLLLAIGRFLDPQQIEALKGMSRFLALDGNPEVLAKTISPLERNEDTTAMVREALRKMQGFNSEAAKGLEAFFALSSRLTSISALRLFNSLDLNTEQVVGIFETFQRLKGHSQGVQKLISNLISDDPSKVKGVIGVLTVANQRLVLHPDAILIFEDPQIVSEIGKVIRITDIREVRPGLSSSLRIEVKEIYSLSSLDAVRQLANDIVSDTKARQSLPVPPGGARPFFETIAWRIRYPELAEAVARRLKVDVKDPKVRPEAIEDVKRRLRPAFEHRVIKEALKQGVITQFELEGYRQAFEANQPGTVHSFIDFF